MSKPQSDPQRAFNAELGAWVFTQRKLSKISRTKLGKRIGAHRNTIMRWEAGQCELTVWQFTRICQELGKQMTVASQNVHQDLLEKVA